MYSKLNNMMGYIDQYELPTASRRRHYFHTPSKLERNLPVFLQSLEESGFKPKRLFDNVRIENNTVFFENPSFLFEKNLNHSDIQGYCIHVSEPNYFEFPESLFFKMFYRIDFSYYKNW